LLACAPVTSFPPDLVDPLALPADLQSEVGRQLALAA